MCHMTASYDFGECLTHVFIHINPFICTHSYQRIHMNSFIWSHWYELIGMSWHAIALHPIIWSHWYELRCDSTASYHFMTAENVSEWIMSHIITQWIMSHINSFRRHANLRSHMSRVSDLGESFTHRHMRTSDSQSMQHSLSKVSSAVILLSPLGTQLTATHCNTLNHTATHCTTLQHTAPCGTTLQHTATQVNWGPKRLLKIAPYRHMCSSDPQSIDWRCLVCVCMCVSVNFSFSQGELCSHCAYARYKLLMESLLMDSLLMDSLLMDSLLMDSLFLILP